MADRSQGEYDFDEPEVSPGKPGRDRFQDDAEERDGWTPPEGMRSHGRMLLDDNEDFFVPPPAEIGEVQSAYSTLKIGKKGSPIQSTVAPLMTFAVLGAATVFIMRANGLPWGAVAFGLSIPALFAYLAWLVVKFRHETSYVGDLGIARFRCAGTRSNIKLSQVFRFGEADELRTAATMNFTNGVYTGTAWTHIWETAEGQRVFRLNGSHNSKIDEPKDPGNLLYLAQAADVAWSIFLLGFALEDFEKVGYFDFRVGKRDSVRIGDGKMIFTLGGKVTEMDLEDLGNASLAGGVMEFQQIGAKKGWFSSKGVFQFDYKDIANARLFLLLLDKKMNVRF